MPDLGFSGRVLSSIFQWTDICVRRRFREFTRKKVLAPLADDAEPDEADDLWPEFRWGKNSAVCDTSRCPLSSFSSMFEA